MIQEPAGFGGLFLYSSQFSQDFCVQFFPIIRRYHQAVHECKRLSLAHSTFLYALFLLHVKLRIFLFEALANLLYSLVILTEADFHGSPTPQALQEG